MFSVTGQQALFGLKDVEQVEQLPSGFQNCLVLSPPCICTVFGMPTGFRLKAQSCEARATLDLDSTVALDLDSTVALDLDSTVAQGSGVFERRCAKLELVSGP